MAIWSITYLSRKPDKSLSFLYPTSCKVDSTWIYSRYSRLHIFHAECFTSFPQTCACSNISNLDEYTHVLSHSSHKSGHSESFSSTPGSILCITESLSLQVTIISHWIVTERAIVPAAAALSTLVLIHFTLSSQSDFCKMPVLQCLKSLCSSSA